MSIDPYQATKIDKREHDSVGQGSYLLFLKDGTPREDEQHNHLLVVMARGFLRSRRRKRRWVNLRMVSKDLIYGHIANLVAEPQYYKQATKRQFGLTHKQNTQGGRRGTCVACYEAIGYRCAALSTGAQIATKLVQIATRLSKCAY